MPLEAASVDSVFVCHNSADKPAVERIAEALRRAKIEPWLDRWKLAPGEEFATEIESAMRDCSAIAVFIGPIGPSNWQKVEINRAINISIETGKPLIPVLLPDAQEDLLGDFLKDRVPVRFRSADDADGVRLLICGIRGESPDDAPSVGPSSTFDDGCPYAGLLGYDVRHAPNFFGRERATERAVEKIEASFGRAGGARFLAILGASGAGKSSFARAGVVHALLARHTEWQYIAFEPSTDPAARMAAELARLPRPSPDSASSTNGGLGDWTAARMTAGGRLIVLVDQFEEVFTRCRDDSARKQFIAELVSAARHPAERCVVLLTLRMDFYEKSSRSEDLASLLADSQIALGPLDTPGLQAVIERPARKQVWDVDPALVASLVADCGPEPPLPLLGIVLQRLWKRCRASRRLTLAAYQEMSLKGAVNELANEIPAADRDAALALFAALAAPNADHKFVRRRIPLAEAVPDDPAGAARLDALVVRLAGPEFRLLTIRSEDGQPTIEPAHEIVFEAWTALRDRLHADFELLVWRQRLEADLLAWKKNPRPEYCISGERLNEAIANLKRRSADLTKIERRYIAECKRHRDRRRAAGATVGAVVLLAAAAVVFIGLSRAAVADLRSAARNQIAKRNPLGLVLAYEVTRHESGEEAESLLQQALQEFSEPLLEWSSDDQRQNGLNDLAISGDGLSVAAAAKDGSVLVWQVPAQAKEGRPHWGPDLGAPAIFSVSAPAANVALSDDGKLVAAGSGAANGRVSAWHVADRSEAFSLDAKGPISAIAVDDPGTAIAAATEGAIRWQRERAPGGNSGSGGLESGTLPLAARALSLSLTRGAVLVAAACDDGLVRIFDRASGREVRPPIEHQGVATYAAFSRDGKLLASGGRMAEARVTTVGGTQTKPPLADGSSVVSTAFSRNGKRVATLRADHSVMIWDAGSARPIRRIPVDAAVKIAISGEGDRIAALLPASFGRDGQPGPGRARIYELEPDELRRSARSMIGLHDDIDCSGYPAAQAACDKIVREAPRR